MKVGRTEAAAKAAASHTGALTGSDEVCDAAFRRAGVLRVNTIGELFNIAELLGKQPRARGPRLAIVTNGGGPGALATDTLIANGGESAALSSESLAALDRVLPSHWSHGNPVDVIGDADCRTLRASRRDRGARSRKRWRSRSADAASRHRADRHRDEADIIREDRGTRSRQRIGT